MLRPTISVGLLSLAFGHPINDVIELIQELKRTARDDQDEADQTFEQTTHEYNNARDEMENEIASQQKEREKQTDLWQSKEAQADALKHEVGIIEKKLGYTKDDEAKLTSARDQANKVFLESEETIKKTIAALEECLAELSKGVPGMLAQKQMEVIAGTFLPKAEQTAVTQFLSAPSAPEARVYDSKTGNITTIFENLVRQFNDKLNASTLAETNDKNAHELSLSALQGKHKTMTQLKSETEAAMGEVGGIRDQAKADAAAAKKAVDQFSKDLRDKIREYNEKKENYEHVSEERRAEMKAMDWALNVLRSIGNVRGEHEEMAPPASKEAAPPKGEMLEPAFFVQLGSLSPKEKIVALLRQAGSQLHSSDLQKLAAKIGATEGPFNQISIMIQRLVDRLVAEQLKEDNHKAWCDTELEKTKAGQKNSESKLEKFEADIGVAETRQEENQTGKEDARKEITTLHQRQASETEMRRKEKKNNDVSVSDSKKAQKAISRALKELKTWDATRDQGVNPTEGNAKVFELLENAGTHYAKMKADVESAEAQAQIDFQQSMNDIKRSIATLDAQIEGHDNTLHRLSQKMDSLSKKRKFTKNNLFELEQYLKDLSPACVGEEGSYEKRKENRTKEQNALKEAQGILREAFNNLETKEALVSVEKKKTSFLQSERALVGEMNLLSEQLESAQT